MLALLIKIQRSQKRSRMIKSRPPSILVSQNRNWQWQSWNGRCLVTLLMTAMMRRWSPPVIEIKHVSNMESNPRMKKKNNRIAKNCARKSISCKIISKVDGEGQNGICYVCGYYSLDIIGCCLHFKNKDRWSNNMWS